MATNETKSIVIELVREDQQNLAEIQKNLDFLIGHDLRNHECFLFYRNHSFLVKMVKKQGET